MNPIIELRSRIADALELTPVSKIAYKGARIVFIFLKTRSFEEDSPTLITLIRNTLVTPPGEDICKMADVQLFPERDLSVPERLAFTSSIINKPCSAQIIVTADPFLMTDALPGSTVIVEMIDHAWTVTPGTFPSFDSAPGFIATCLAGSSATIGEVAKCALEEWLSADRSGRAPELWHLMDEIEGENSREPLLELLEEVSGRPTHLAA